MMAALLSLALGAPWHAPTDAPVVDGLATYYAEGVMAHVAVNRGYIRRPEEYGAWLQRTGFAGTVALNRAGDLDRVVWLEYDGEIEGPFLSIDCAQYDHYAQRLAQDRVVEVNWATAQRWKMRGPVPVRVFFHDPRPWHGLFLQRVSEARVS